MINCARRTFIAWKTISFNQTSDLYHLQFRLTYIIVFLVKPTFFILPFNLYRLYRITIYRGYRMYNMWGGRLNHANRWFYDNNVIILFRFLDWNVAVSFCDYKRQSFARRIGHTCFRVENVMIGCTTCRWNTVWTKVRFHNIMDVASTDYLKTALYSGDNGSDTGNRDSLRLMELGLHLETLHDGSHRLNTSVDHLLNDPSLSGEHCYDDCVNVYRDVELIFDFTFK